MQETQQGFAVALEQVLHRRPVASLRLMDQGGGVLEIQAIVAALIVQLFLHVPIVSRFAEDDNGSRIERHHVNSPALRSRATVSRSRR